LRLNLRGSNKLKKPRYLRGLQRNWERERISLASRLAERVGSEIQWSLNL